MPSVNELLLDGQISHSVDLHQYANHVVRRIIALLNRTDADLAAKLNEALERLPPESFTVQRLEDLLLSVRMVNAQAYKQIGEELGGELRDLAAHEVGFQYELFRSVVPKQVNLAQTSAEQAYAAALSRPMQGRLLREWTQSIEEARMARIRDAIRIGYVSNETVPQIVQRIRGTRARGYSDGLIEIDRRGAESVVRTAISHVAGVARDNFFEANGDLIKAVEWCSTIDLRTSPMCRIRDRLRYQPGTHKPIGHSVPWLAGPGRLHWCCRSTSVPITKSWRELGIAMDDMAPTERASMDGAIPADTTYAQWLKRQSAKRQDEVLGPVRGALLRKGGLALQDMYTDKGRFLSLSELKARESAAFAKAGVEA